MGKFFMLLLAHIGMFFLIVFIASNAVIMLIIDTFKIQPKSNIKLTSTMAFEEFMIAVKERVPQNNQSILDMDYTFSLISDGSEKTEFFIETVKVIQDRLNMIQDEEEPYYPGDPAFNAFKHGILLSPVNMLAPMVVESGAPTAELYTNIIPILPSEFQNALNEARNFSGGVGSWLVNYDNRTAQRLAGYKINTNLKSTGPVNGESFDVYDTYIHAQATAMGPSQIEFGTRQNPLVVSSWNERFSIRNNGEHGWYNKGTDIGRMTDPSTLYTQIDFRYTDNATKFETINENGRKILGSKWDSMTDEQLIAIYVLFSGATHNTPTAIRIGGGLDYLIFDNTKTGSTYYDYFYELVTAPGNLDLLRDRAVVWASQLINGQRIDSNWKGFRDYVNNSDGPGRNFKIPNIVTIRNNETVEQMIRIPGANEGQRGNRACYSLQVLTAYYMYEELMR